MGFLSDFKNKIVNKWNLSRNFTPYFNKLDNDLKRTNIIDDGIDPKITQIYNDLCSFDRQRYSRDIKRYDDALINIKKHNNALNAIDKIIGDFDFQTILSNPHAYSFENIHKYDEAIELLKSFEKTTLKYDDFIGNYYCVLNDYQTICKGYDLVTKANAIIKIEDSAKYLDSAYKKKITEEFNSLKSEFDALDARFYDFPLLVDFVKALTSHNDKFVNDNAKDPFFDSINGKKLDNEQREAILKDETATLVVAGAGCGKTLTICGKVKYLLEKENVSPSDILLLSYSANSAEDLANKVKKINNALTVGTFHKIGLQILKITNEKSLMIENQFNEIIETYFREVLKDNPSTMAKVLNYYGLYKSTFSAHKVYKNEGDLFEELKKDDFTTLKDNLVKLTDDYNSRETIKKELVKSFEEMAIANWYFIHGVNYVYESPYEHDLSTPTRRQYMPDFKLTDYKVYHEHYGLNKDGHASQFEGEEAKTYQETVRWKRQIHLNYQTDCIETFSYEFEDGTIFQKLEEELKKRNIKTRELSKEEILNSLNSIYNNRPFRSFINLIKSFLSLYKSLYRDENGFKSLKSSSFKNSFERQRANLFLDIVEDVYKYYMNYLRREKKIDFDDMILNSIVELDKTNSYKYKYIIVDEFQDISVSRMRFLKKLIEHGKSKLFAVGDDWQAIYRFCGCDLGIFIDFPKYFGESAICKITTTHRNSQELQDIAGPFIKKNPEQFNKTINSERRLEKPVRIHYYEESKIDGFLEILNEISNIKEDASVLILGRNNKDLDDITDSYKIYKDFKESDEKNTVIKCSSYPKLKLTFNTVHSSKGLEDDYVVIINAEDSYTGFPCKMEDDSILDLVLSHKSSYEYAEERRLWYVALTRTRNYTFILTDPESESVFVKEIKDQCLITNPSEKAEKHDPVLCPKCKTGKLILRSNSKKRN